MMLMVWKAGMGGVPSIMAEDKLAAR